MAWLLEQNEINGIENLKNLLKQKKIIKAPGVHNCLTAKIAKDIGFDCVYISGAAFSASRVLPDLGYFTVDELANYVRQIYRITKQSIIVDVDTGFGEVLYLARTVLEMEEAGASAIQIEDQELPKKCGHVEGKKLVSSKAMCQKIEAAKKFSKNILIIARTDAHALHGPEEALKRAKDYVSAGADIIFPEALHTKNEFQQFSETISVPLLANMTEFGKTPYFTAEEFESWGYKIIIYPVSTLRVAMKAVEELLSTIYKTGTQKEVLDKMQTRKELYKTIGYQDYIKFDNEFTS